MGLRTTDRNALIEIADKAYDIGLFNGGVPIVLACYIPSASTSQTQMAVLYSNPMSADNTPTLPKTKGYTPSYSGATLSFKYTTSGTTYSLIMRKVALCTEGSYGGTESNVSSLTFSSTSTGWKLIAHRNAQGEWVIPSNSYAVPTFDDGNEVSPSLQNIIDNYNEALSNDTPNGPTVSYTLNIPAIISSVPNAAKLFINNAFGFDLFGINIAGLLSVLLIVAIVGFVVAWLMSR